MKAHFHKDRTRQTFQIQTGDTRPNIHRSAELYLMQIVFDRIQEVTTSYANRFLSNLKKSTSFLVENDFFKKSFLFS